MSSIKCEECNLTFAKTSNLKRHARNKHQIEIISTRKQREAKSSKSPALILKCGICDLEDTKQQLDLHYVNAHQIDLNVENLTFANFQSFLDWKVAIEKENKCRFVSLCGRKQNIERYICHRSGHFKSKSKGLRSLKKQGSKKIGTYCPSKITVYVNDDLCDVKFARTHVGHENELHHVSLSQDVRVIIAHKLSQKIPLALILEEIKSSMAQNNDRTHLLTMKDLHNISKEFKISHENADEKNTQTLTTFLENLNGEESPVIYFKPRGCIDKAYSQFKEDDFALILANRSQKEFLRQFSHNVVVIDRTSKVSFDLHLFIVIVVDELRTAFPGCFFLCSREDELVLKAFFTILKDRIGPIQTNILMSYTYEQCYRAWVSVMDAPKHHLLSSWNVNQAWKSNLTKIKDEEKNNEVRTLLTNLLEEQDSKKFPVLLNDLVGKITGQEETRSFGLYFCKFFLKNVNKWALCYRSHLGLDECADVEKSCKIIKCIYFTTKKNGGLNDFLLFLFRFLRDKFFTSDWAEKKSSFLIKNLKNNHALVDSKSYKITDGNVDKLWIVTSVAEKAVYEIKRLNNNCNCEIVCESCQTCMHSYVCSCLQSSMNWEMCGHIHYFCTYKANIRIEPMLVNVPVASEKDEILENYFSDDGYNEEEYNDESETVVEQIPENYGKINAVSQINSLMDELIMNMDSDDDSIFVLNNLERMVWYLKAKNSTKSGRIENVIIK